MDWARRYSIVFLAPGDARKGRVEPISWMHTCRAFADRGHDVTLVSLAVRCPDAVGRDEIWSHFGIAPAFRVRVLPTPLAHHSPVWWFRVCAGGAMSIFAAARLARQPGKRPLVVYSRSPILAAPFLALRRAVPRARRPCVILETHVLPDESIRRILCAVDLIVVNSRKLESDIARTFQLSPTRVIYAPLGPFNPIGQYPKDEARGKLKIPLSSSIACYSGKMTETQNEFLLQIARRVKDRLRSFRLLLVGGNPGILSWTRRRIAELGLEDAVELTGFVAPAKVDLYQAAADVLVFHMDESLLHYRYATPAKAYEYMAAGRPIVANDIPLFAEVFGDDGERAIRVRGRDPESMARAIERALELGEEGRLMSERARESVRGRTWEARVEIVLRALALREAAAS
jgi:glycosyltransferase involved in cell wall biosynthesis